MARRGDAHVTTAMLERAEVPHPPAESPCQPAVAAVLRTARRLLGMDLAFLGEFVGGREVFRSLDGDAAAFGIVAGEDQPLAGSYCLSMVRGSIPAIIASTADETRVADRAVTHRLGIGSYVGARVELPGGRLYGALCCLGREPRPALGERDLTVLGALAAVLGDALADPAHRAHERYRGPQRLRPDCADIEAVLAAGGPRMAFQPIVTLADGAVEGYEALARFPALGGITAMPPPVWFAAADACGLGRELELSAVQAALRMLPLVPAGRYLTGNLSPATLVDPGFARVVEAVALDRVVLELTEHAEVSDYDHLAAVLAPLRRRGLRVAVDDAGAGYASLRHVLRLSPDVVKLDASLTRGIDTDAPRRALTEALVGFAGAQGARVIAEGVGTVPERMTLRQLGVAAGQGYGLGRPALLPAA